MSAESDILRPYYIEGLTGVSGVTNTTFKNWIDTAPLILDSYDIGVKKFTFYIGDKSSFLRSIAYDISRMTIATFESIYDISAEYEIPRSTAWPLIRAYYSAFFAGHALLRILGHAVVQLEKSQSEKLTAALKFHSNPPSVNIGDGLHLIIVNKGLSSFSIQKLSNGSHEDTWSVLAELLIKVSKEFLLDRNPVSQQKKQTFFNQMDELVSIMKSHPCHHRANWLSKLRNEVNYQHKHGVWYPHEKSKNFRENVFDNLTSWNKKPSLKINDKSHHIDKFTQACTFLVALVRELIYDVSSRNSDNDSFLKVIALKVIKQAEKKRG